MRSAGTLKSGAPVFWPSASSWSTRAFVGGHGLSGNDYFSVINFLLPSAHRVAQTGGEAEELSEELWPTSPEATVADEDDFFDPLKIDAEDDAE